MILNQLEIQHLYWRAGFSITPNKLNQITGWSKDQIIEDLIKTSSVSESLSLDLSKFEVDRSKLSQKEKKELRREAQKSVLELNLLWLDKMRSTDAVLRERITLFFHDHFAVRIKNPRANLHLNNIIRKHALGSFREMLMEVSKSPAMILFLNNQQNKKGHPNENFAREVMELFTLGRDNGYTEDDIKEAARAFTGWSINKKGQFLIKQKHHDTGVKTILGQTDNFTGEDVINLLLDNKQTAKHITSKLVEYIFARPIGENELEKFSNVFYQSEYNLETLVRSMLKSEIMFSSETIGCKIKSPTDLIVGIMKLVEIDFKDPKVIINVQRKLNQLLFFPPNVAGWNHGKAWIDSSTLILRLKIPSLVLNNGVIEYLDDSELSENMMERKNKTQAKTQARIEKRIKAYPSWDKFSKEIESQKSRLASFLLQKEPIADVVNFDEELKDQLIQIMSLPEYQLC